MARIAFVADDLFEDSELRVPWDRVRQAGHETVLDGLEKGKEIHGKRGKERFTTDVAARDVTADEFDAVVIPGGYSPDHLRTDIKMVGLTRDTYLKGKPLAAVCHAPWMLVEADVAESSTRFCTIHWMAVKVSGVASPNSTPTIPPAPDSTIVSVRNWRMMSR